MRKLFTMKYLLTGIVVIILVFMAISYKSLKKVFRSEVDSELDKYSPGKPVYLTAEDIAHLPQPVQRYLNYCGLVGKEKIRNAQVVWEEFYLKMDPAKDWTTVKCSQFNNVIAPARIAYMHAYMNGFIPFSARDKYQDGSGNMWVRAASLFTVYDVKGPEMDRSALVTVLAEALFIPGYATEKYITWEPVDSLSAKATLTYNNMAVSGIFYFNEKGEFIRFESSDRYYYEADKGTSKNIKWSAETGSYKENNGIKFPTELKATWHTDTGDYTYARGTIAAFRYNISALD